MKARRTSGSIAIFAACAGLVAALFAGGCAAEAEGADGGGAAEGVFFRQGAEAGEGAADEAHEFDTHALGAGGQQSHSAYCQCGICTGGRQAGAVAGR